MAEPHHVRDFLDLFDAGMVSVLIEVTVEVQSMKPVAAAVQMLLQKEIQQGAVLMLLVLQETRHVIQQRRLLQVMTAIATQDLPAAVVIWIAIGVQVLIVQDITIAAETLPVVVLEDTTVAVTPVVAQVD